MAPTTLTAALAALALAALPTIALADDWQVIKLRGNAAMLVGDTWQPLQRGDVVSDDRAIRTVGGSRMTLERGLEMLDLGPDTAIRIDDRNGKKFTTVKQYFGTVGVEAEVRNVKHFAVVSPDLAAVVKGTHFTVVAGKSGSTVSVQRGHVAVTDDDTGENVVLAAGQSASTTEGDGLDIEGSGDLPVVLDSHGKAAQAGKENAPGQMKKGSETSGSGHAAIGKGQGSDGNSGSNGNSGSGSSSGSNGGGSSNSNAGSGGGSSNAGGNGNGNGNGRN